MPATPIIRNIEQQLVEMRKAEPPENGYASYKAFQVEMHIIRVYPFRERFLFQLIDLAYNCYIPKTRYNRKDMFDTLYKYYRRCSPERYMMLPEEAVNKLFYIFEHEALKPNKIRVPINFMLKGQRLNDEQLQFLVKYAFKSEIVLNRVLQYPFASDIILNWAKYYAEDARLSKRRMEVTSWLMDERRYAIPSISLLYDDLKQRFDNLMEMDVYGCITKMQKQKVWERSADEYDNEIKSFIAQVDSKRSKGLPDCITENTDEVKTLRKLAFNAAKHTGLYLTDFDDVEPVDLYQSRVTVWAIAYSRLDISIKVNMLKHQYRDELA